MANIAPGTVVELLQEEAARLLFPPPANTLVVAVHPAALKAANRLTLACCLDEDDVVAWVGALDERMLQPTTEVQATPRAELGKRLQQGGDRWVICRPGLLTNPNPYLTVYGNERPWVVLGDLPNGDVLAAPLNDASGNPKWWTPIVRATELGFCRAKDSQIELAHVWSLPKPEQTEGPIANSARPSIEQAISRYFPA